MTKSSKYLQTVFFCYSSVPSYKRRVDGWLNSVFGKLFANNYSKNKTKFSFVFSSLIFAFSSLVKYNFEQVIVSRNYIILHSRIKNIFYFSLTWKYSKFQLQADLTICPFQGDRVLGVRSSNQRCSVKQAVLKNVANSEENICVGDSF